MVGAPYIVLNKNIFLLLLGLALFQRSNKNAIISVMRFIFAILIQAKKEWEENSEVSSNEKAEDKYSILMTKIR